MEFSKEALELLQATARKAAEPKIVDLPLAGRSARVGIDGVMIEIPLPPANRAHAVRTLDDLARYAIVAASDHEHQVTTLAEGQTVTGPPVVYHDERACVLVLNDADRRDLVRFELEPTEQWILLSRLAKEKPALAQREVIQALRLVFKAGPALIAAFRRIDLKSKTSAESQVHHGRESLGRSVETEIVNAADIPETFVLSVPIYRNRGEDQRYDVVCAVEIDVVNARVQIVPEPGRLDEVMHLHQADIADRLAAAFAEEESAEHVAVYYGSP